MRTIELFSGTASFSKIAKKLGHETFTVDNNPMFNPDHVGDLLDIDDTIDQAIDDADIIWMSPPCQTFSMVSGNRHWTADRQPKTQKAKDALRMLKVCFYVAERCEVDGKIFFIENPRARARWFLPKEWRKTVWYCQYGDKRAKPTDIWTNLDGWEPKTCKNGNPDCHHERAPRGSKTGTQGLKGAKERGVIPSALFEEIFGIIESHKQLKVS